MKKQVTLTAALAALALLAPPRTAGAAGTPPAGGTWEIEGVFSDACQCAVFCPCEFSEKPTFGHCDDAGILNILKGHWGDQKLDGLRVVVVSQSPHGERLVDTVGRLKFAHIYVSKESTDAQMNALAEIVRRSFGVFANGVSRISPNETVERVPMKVTIEPYRYRAVIPGILNLDLEAITGGDGKTPIVVKNHPFNPLGLDDPLVAHSKVYTYKRGDINWNYSGRSASIRHFKLSGEIQPRNQQGSLNLKLAPAEKPTKRR
jgi:hypothetical protein